MNNMNGGGMMKQLMQMQKQLKQTQKELEREIVTGSSVDGTVKIMLTGTQKFHRVTIDEEKAKGVSASEMEKMIGAALKDALEQSRKLMADKLGPLGGGLSGLKN
jgi:DNA-binding YbaB/EbfC family protein